MLRKLSLCGAIAILAASPSIGPEAHADGLELANQSSAPVADSFTVESADFHASLFLRNTTSRDAQLTLSISKLRSADGRLSALEMQVGTDRVRSGGRAPLPHGGTIEIALSGNVPDVGIYRAELSVQSDEKDAPLKTFALSVERKAASLPDGLVEVPVLFRQDLSFLSGADTFTLNGTMRNTLGRPIRVGRPQVVEVDEKQGAAAYARDDVSSVTSVGCLPLQKPNSPIVRLDTPQRCPFSIVLNGLAGGAVYDVKLSVAGIDSTSEASKTVSVSVRRSWPFALILVLVGAVLAFLVRWWRGDGRALFAQLAAVAALTEQIGVIRRGAFGDEQRRTVEAVAANISQLKTHLRDGSVSGDKADGCIAALKQQADLLLVWLRVEADRDTLSADDRASIEAKRNSAIDGIVTTHDGVDAGVKTALDAYSEAVRSYLAAQKIREQAASFVASVDEYIAALDGQPEKSDLKGEVDALKAACDKLRQSIAAPDPDLPGAIDDARTAYVALNVRLLELRVNERTPAGFIEAEWAQDRDALQAKLAAVKAASSTKEREALLNDALSALAQTRYGRLRALLDTAVARADEAKRARLNQLRVTEPTVPMDARMFELWYARHRAERENVAKAMTAPTAAAAMNLLGATPESTVAALDPSLFDVKLGPIVLPSVDASAYAVGKSARRWEIATNVIVALLAGLSGLQALWISNFAWGSASDMIVAIFWGAGAGYGLGAGIEELIRKGTPTTSH